MPGSRGNEPTGASPERLDEWRRRRVPALQRRYDRNAGEDAALPLDMLADPERTRRAIADRT